METTGEVAAATPLISKTQSGVRRLVRQSLTISLPISQEARLAPSCTERPLSLLKLCLELCLELELLEQEVG